MECCCWVASWPRNVGRDLGPESGPGSGPPSLGPHCDEQCQGCDAVPGHTQNATTDLLHQRKCHRRAHSTMSHLHVNANTIRYVFLQAGRYSKMGERLTASIPKWECGSLTCCTGERATVVRSRPSCEADRAEPRSCGRPSGSFSLSRSFAFSLSRPLGSFSFALSFAFGVIFGLQRCGQSGNAFSPQYLLHQKDTCPCPCRRVVCVWIKSSSCHHVPQPLAKICVGYAVSVQK